MIVAVVYKLLFLALYYYTFVLLLSVQHQLLCFLWITMFRYKMIYDSFSIVVV